MMATVFYAVSGEGMGHATRSEVVIKHLIKKRHKIVIFSYDRAFRYLKKQFKKYKSVLEIVEISGINFVYEKNEFKLRKTLIQESKKIRGFLVDNVKTYTDKILEYSPNLVITDFEPAAGNFAKILKIPLITIDNQSFFSKCEVDENFLMNLSVQFIRALQSFKGDYNFIVSVFEIPIRDKYKENTFFLGAILRDKIKKAVPSKKDHVLVYQTSKSNKKLFEVLKSVDEKFIVYGFNKEKKEDNIIMKKPSVNGFVKDLASCKAVITNGGFTLISESVYLRKPIYSVPVKKQTEQEINGYYLEKKGLGLFSKEVNKKDLEYFLSNLHIYERNLLNLSLKVNDFTILDEKIDLIVKDYEVPKRAIMLEKIREKVKQLEEKYFK